MTSVKEYRLTAVFTQFFVTLSAFWLVRRLSVTAVDYYAGALGCAISMTFYFWLKLRGVERLMYPAPTISRERSAKPQPEVPQ